MAAKKDVYEPAVGDVVALNSGGPDMTVVKVCPAVPAANSSPPSAAKEAEIHCMWFNPLLSETGGQAGGILQTAAFHPEAVTVKKPVTPPTS